MSSNDAGYPGPEDPDLEAIKSRVRELDEEAGELRRSDGGDVSGDSDVTEVDSRSVYVGNFDYYATDYDLMCHFKGCASGVKGGVKRVTIPRNAFDGRPKGYAFVEFDDEALAGAALAFNGTILNGRVIKVPGLQINSDYTLFSTEVLTC